MSMGVQWGLVVFLWVFTIFIVTPLAFIGIMAKVLCKHITKRALMICLAVVLFFTLCSMLGYIVYIMSASDVMSPEFIVERERGKQ